MPKAKKASDYQEKRKRYKANNNAVRKTPREEALEALEQMKLLQSARSPLYKFVVYTPSPVVIETTSPEKYSRYIKDMQRRQAQSKLSPCKVEPQDV